MSAFRILEWVDTTLPVNAQNWNERRFNESIDRLWDAGSHDAEKPIYTVFDLADVGAFREFLCDECKSHRQDGQLLGIICHGHDNFLMQKTSAAKEEMLALSEFWSVVEDGLGCSGYQTVVFGSCEAMKAPSIHVGLAPNSVTTIIGYSGSPEARHVIALLASLCAHIAGGFEAVQLAIADAGASREQLIEGFKAIDEFLKPKAVDPLTDGDFVPEEVDPTEGQVLILGRAWGAATPLPLV